MSGKKLYQVEMSNDGRMRWKDINDETMYRRTEVILSDESSRAYQASVNQCYTQNMYGEAMALEKPRFLELNDRKTNAELHRHFNCMNYLDFSGNNSYPSTSYAGYTSEYPYMAYTGVPNYLNTIDSSGRRDFCWSKLPAGTIFIKQDRNNINNNINNLNRLNNLNNINKLGKNSMKSCYNADKRNMKGMSASSIENIKSICSDKTETMPIRKKRIIENTKNIDESNNRPMLMAAKRKENLDDFIPDNKKIKYSNVPYMNTRSVTKKLYNIGATLHAPSTKDKIEWREWPVHGMHERPVYHPQIGLATEFIGREFISSDGYSYQEISQSVSEMAEIPPSLRASNKETHSRDENTAHNNQNINNNQFTNHTEVSFENCMHSSFHSVLAYAAMLISPHYRRIIDEAIIQKNIANDNEHSVHPSTLSNLMDELLLTNPTESNPNFINKPELNPNNYQNSMKPYKIKPVRTPLSLKCIKNQAELQRVLQKGPKNTLILLKTTDPNMKKDNNDNNSRCLVPATKSSLETIKNLLMPVKVDRNAKTGNFFVKTTKTYDGLALKNQNFDSMRNNNKEVKKGHVDEASAPQTSKKQITNQFKKVRADSNKNRYSKRNMMDNSLFDQCTDDNLIQELIQDTAVLYCAAVGVHQDDLANYLDNLDAEQCLSWFNY